MNKHPAVSRILSRGVICALAVNVWGIFPLPAEEKPGGELLYNGIRLPATWPPHEPYTREPMAVPYLTHPPEVIPIDVGRQQFVDDFLVQETTLRRVFHRPEESTVNPVVRKVWVLSLAIGRRPGHESTANMPSLTKALAWTARDLVPWVGADHLDPHHPDPQFHDIEPRMVQPRRGGVRERHAGIVLDLAGTGERHLHQAQDSQAQRGPRWRDFHP